MNTATPRKATTHYQTSFRVIDPDHHIRRKLMEAVYEWVLRKEPDSRVRGGQVAFAFRCYWPNLYRTHSAISTESFLGKEGHAWAMHYVEVDREVGTRRLWYSDVGLKQEGTVVIASVRISFARNDEDLSCDWQVPATTVPGVVRRMMEGKHVFSGRPEFRLLQRPIQFNEVGTGKALADFIQSPNRRYPLVVFNGDFAEHSDEAARLARELTGKCQVAIVANNQELAEEIETFLPADYRIPWERLRVFFPFGRGRPSPMRHRWYDMRAAEYGTQRVAMVSGLLRNHSLFEEGAVETIEDILRLENRSKLMTLEAATPEYRRQLEEFLDEHTLVAGERDQFKREAAIYATEVDERERELSDVKAECATYRDRLQKLDSDHDGRKVLEIFHKLPSNLVEVAKAAGLLFPRLIITENALRTAEDFHECSCVSEAWEMFVHLSQTLHTLKFEDQEKDLEGKFNAATRYELGMSEGKMTKDDTKLMRLRRLHHNGKDYDITPHLKHGNYEPKLVRIYFAFDEEMKRIVVGHIGRHIPNFTSKKL